MHEAAVCRELMEIVSAAAQQNEMSQVSSITLAVGPYSCVVQEQLQVYFDAAKPGTCMSEAYILVELDETLTGKTQMVVRSFEGE